MHVNIDKNVKNFLFVEKKESVMQGDINNYCGFIKIHHHHHHHSVHERKHIRNSREISHILFERRDIER